MQKIHKNRCILTKIAKNDGETIKNVRKMMVAPSKI